MGAQLSDRRWLFCWRGFTALLPFPPLWKSLHIDQIVVVRLHLNHLQPFVTITMQQLLHWPKHCCNHGKWFFHINFAIVLGSCHCRLSRLSLLVSYIRSFYFHVFLRLFVLSVALQYKIAALIINCCWQSFATIIIIITIIIMIVMAVSLPFFLHFDFYEKSLLWEFCHPLYFVVALLMQ